MSWPRRTLGDLVREPLRNGRSVKDRPGGFPVLRLTALGSHRVNLKEAKEGDWGRAEAAPFLVQEGDFLISRGNGSLRRVARGALVGASPSEVAFPDTMIRARPDSSRIHPDYLALAWAAPETRSHIEKVARTTAGIYKVSQKDLASVTLPVPDLGEQQRVVEILEDHLSHLDAAEASFSALVRRQRALTRSILVHLIPEAHSYPSSWETSTVAAVGTVELGRQRHPDWHSGPNMRPYLRVANVFEDRIDTSDVKEMHWPEGTFERFRLHDGDVLLNEGQTPELLGRPAIYRGEPKEVAFTNSLIRFKAGPKVLPEFALLVGRPLHSVRSLCESSVSI